MSNLTTTTHQNLHFRVTKITGQVIRVAILLLATLFFTPPHSLQAQDFKRGNHRVIQGGILQADTTQKAEVVDSLSKEEMKQRAKLARRRADSLYKAQVRFERAQELGRVDANGNIIPREPWFGDSVSLSKLCFASALLPGYGQIYNKQYWKLPLLYGTIGGSIGLSIAYGNKYRPLKKQYDKMLTENLSRSEELNLVQRRMIRANTTRQIFMMTAVASYIYFLGDTAINYSTNQVSNVKKATTLSMICPGAGQVYNKSYWKVPIVIGGLGSMVYVIDWNTRGYKRYKTAHALRADFDQHPENYPDGVSKDEFRGRYTASYLKNLRDSFRRNRDLSILLTVAVYAFQAVDAHVDAHLKDFDISDNLTVQMEPMFDYQQQLNGSHPVFGVNLNLTF